MNGKLLLVSSSFLQNSCIKLKIGTQILWTKTKELAKFRKDQNIMWKANITSKNHDTKNPKWPKKPLKRIKLQIIRTSTTFSDFFNNLQHNFLQKHCRFKKFLSVFGQCVALMNMLIRNDQHLLLFRQNKKISDCRFLLKWLHWWDVPNGSTGFEDYKHAFLILSTKISRFLTV